MRIVKHIPNFITSLNLLTGCVGIMYAFTDRMEYSDYCIWLAILFDFFDGFVARTLKVSSPIGKELDSLADMVTFGVLPSIIMFQLIHPLHDQIAYIAFSIAIFSALRLAKFNTDDSQSDQFIGVPTPANALFISSLVFVIITYPNLNHLTSLLFVTLICSFWLIMPVRLLALKFKSYKFSDNAFRYVFVFLSLAFIPIFKYIAIPLIILLYLIISIVKNTVYSNNIN